MLCATLCAIFLTLPSSFFTITFHSNHNSLLFLMVLYTMVHFSSKQDQLNSIIQTLEVSLPAELNHYAEELQDLHFDADDYDSSPDTDNGPTPLLAGLIHMYTLIAQQRYSVSQIHTGLLREADRAPGPICHDKAKPFPWLGNGARECDASLQCGYNIGTLIAWTEQTVCRLLELNKEVMQFASEAERQSASAWVQRTTRVEEWGKGWLVVDGTHVPLAWKPGMMSREHFSYKGFYSMNVTLVILPHSLCIVESVVGQLVVSKTQRLDFRQQHPQETLIVLGRG
ncbi:uncharacterized protein UBRO_21085 [Ustilago bromivora]|uniref:DDE Tnp4 domain-containing protein n=1 Tax=Ustilago bromivora TaxID=307758 RepID=A0A1K0HDY8_9BASI|nr:uncharacterized protein UBRO_21085 [Ustilago bromivora]